MFTEDNLNFYKNNLWPPGRKIIVINMEVKEFRDLVLEEMTHLMEAIDLTPTEWKREDVIKELETLIIHIKKIKI